MRRCCSDRSRQTGRERQNETEEQTGNEKKGGSNHCAAFGGYHGIKHGSAVFGQQFLLNGRLFSVDGGKS